MLARHPGECKPHKYQDTNYGNGVRVMNPASKEGKILGYRCTVCAPNKSPNVKRGGVYDISDLQIVKRY
jgi:hypothetical protein